MKLRNAKKLNMRGFTIVELTMVMAISAIIAVMIVSFSVLISAQVKQNQLRADFMQATVDFRNDLYKEFGKVDDGSSIELLDNNTVKIGNNPLSYDLTKYEYINEITFEAQGDILKVIVTNTQLEESQSFVLISKVGE